MNRSLFSEGGHPSYSPRWAQLESRGIALPSGATTVDVVGVRAPQKFKLVVFDTSKKLTGNVKPILVSKRMQEISHFPTAAKCTEGCVIKLHMHETLRNLCGCGPTKPFARPPKRLGMVTPLPHFPLLDAFGRYRWTFVVTGKWVSKWG